MTRGAYPRHRVEGVLRLQALPPSYRITPQRHIGAPLGCVPADSRFCTLSGGFGVLYATPDFATAFIETVVRDRFTRKTDRLVRLAELTRRAWLALESKPRLGLSLLDLRGDGCARLGAPSDTVRARNHAAGRALGRAVHDGHPDIDGFLFPSRLTGADVYALYDRSVAKLRAGEPGPLAEHPELPAVLERHGIRILR